VSRVVSLASRPSSLNSRFFSWFQEYKGDYKPAFTKLKNNDKLWKLTVENTQTGEQQTYITAYVCIATGHHVTPKKAKFHGDETFTGQIIHSVKYKSATINEMTNKRVLVVGIGNSAVDVATNLVNEGRHVLFAILLIYPLASQKAKQS
jgi:cation diffusion facilitator CzcD-associated flavoprotein CzcO